MEAKVDLCSSGLIIGRRRYELAGLDCRDRGALQVTVMKPVAESEWSASSVINPADSARSEKATGEQGARGLANLNCRELIPDSPADHKAPNNTLSIVSAQMVVLPPKLLAIAMGLSSGRQD